ATGTVRGAVRLVTEDRRQRDLTENPLFQQAAEIRRMTQPADAAQTAMPLRHRAERRPALPPPTAPVNFQAQRTETTRTGEGKIRIVRSGDVTRLQRRPKGDFIELQAQRAVLYTPLDRLQDAQDIDADRIQDVVKTAYLEGDVRVIFTPSGNRGEQRLRAQQVYYDFETDQAMLTKAVLQARQPELTVPVFVRAETIRQLALGEYEVEKAELTTSAFAVPSYA